MFRPERTERIRELAIRTFQVLGCGGLARVDFFLKGEEIFVNEVNTLPGFTSISMYPKALGRRRESRNPS